MAVITLPSLFSVSANCKQAFQDFLTYMKIPIDKSFERFDLESKTLEEGEYNVFYFLVYVFLYQMDDDTFIYAKKLFLNRSICDFLITIHEDIAKPSSKLGKCVQEARKYLGSQQSS